MTDSVITLKEMEYRCPTKPTPDEMREYFENEFIDKLREACWCVERLLYLVFVATGVI